MPGQDGFAWDEEANPMEGYDTEEEEAPAPPPVSPPPPARPVLPRPAVAKPSPNLVTETLEELEDPQPDEFSEAERRLAKAGFYRDVMNNQLLSSEHPCAIEVEAELQAWAKERLEQLLGIRAEPKAAAKQEVVAKLPFSQEQVDALKLLADKVLNKTTQPPTQPAPAAPTQPTVVPVKTAPAAAVKPVPSAKPAPAPRRAPAPGPQIAPQPQPTRGRGRPRKDGTGKNDPTTGEMYDGLPIKLMPDGTKYVDSANGRRYKLEPREVVHKQTGERRIAYMPIELSKREPPPKPYPSEAEVEQMAAQEAAKNTSAAQAMTAVVNVGGVPQKITGNALIQAAMNAPEKEEYIPEDPRKK